MRVRACLTAVVAASILLGAGALPRSAQAEPVYTYGWPFDLPIPGDSGETRGWMDDAVINVPDHFVVTDLDVVVSLTHTLVFDLQLQITSPSGTTVLLNMYDPFYGYFEGQDYQDTIFDDEASVSISDGDAPFTGRFRPVDLAGLAAFDGEDAFGDWRLEIYDAYYGDSGTLEYFALVLTTPEPATAVLLLMGIGLVKRRRSARHGLC
jgi:subtilisin-like proprotein convertase family protein